MRLNLWSDIEDEPAFQLAPMIDVVFILLIFYVLISLFTRLEAELAVQVPTAKQGVIEGRSHGEIIINVLEDGSIKVNQQPMSRASLISVLTDISASYKGGSVIVRGDENATWDDIVAVVDACAQADIWNISFATLPPPETAP